MLRSILSFFCSFCHKNTPPDKKKARDLTILKKMRTLRPCRKTNSPYDLQKAFVEQQKPYANCKVPLSGNKRIFSDCKAILSANKCPTQIARGLCRATKVLRKLHKPFVGLQTFSASCTEALSGYKSSLQSARTAPDSDKNTNFKQEISLTYKIKNIMELIEDIGLTRLSNSLYMQFMDDVDEAIRDTTPEVLKIKNLYGDFSALLEKLDESYQLQKRNNITATLDEKDKIRKDRLRCFLLHVEADQYNEDPTKRESSRVITNRMDSYGNILRASRRNVTARMKDAGQALQAEPLAEEVENIGQTDNVAAFIAANEAYHTLSLERTEERKQLVIKAMLSNRNEMDDVYRKIVSVVNSQVTLNALMDEDTGSGSEPGLPEVQAEGTDNPLVEFVKTINALIKETREEAERTGSTDKTPTEPTEEPDGEEKPTDEPTETPDEEQPTEPDDRPVVQ